MSTHILTTRLNNYEWFPSLLSLSFLVEIFYSIDNILICFTFKLNVGKLIRLGIFYSIVRTTFSCLNIVWTTFS